MVQIKSEFPFQILSKVLQSSLKLASDTGYISIAFPAIGTGNHSIPRDVVANTMFTEVIKFSAANPGTSLRDVRFVLWKGDKSTVDVSVRCGFDFCPIIWIT